MIIELIIFDCDGVLVDSERVANTVLSAALQALGLPYTMERTIASFMGGSMKSCVAQIEQELGRPLTAQWLDQVQADTFKAFETTLTEVAGVSGMLDQLQPQYKSCIASSGDYIKLHTTLTKTQLKPRFEGRIFSAVDVKHGKPAPDLFLHAAQQMGVLPARCVVIEDSVFGVQAARAAEMQVFGYAAMTAPEVLQRAGAKVFTDMVKLPQLIKELNR